MSRTATTRALATTSSIGLIVAVVATVLGHIGLGPGYDPFALTVSDYALSDRGGAIEVAMVALAGGSLALLAGLSGARAPTRGLPTVLMLVWSVGLLIAAIVPTDQPGVSSMSTAAYVHRYASVAGFVSLPIAAAILASRFRTAKPWASLSSPLRRLTVVCAVGLAAFWYVAFPGGRVLMGLVERSLIAVEIVMLLTLTVGLINVVSRNPGRPAPVRTRTSEGWDTVRGDAEQLWHVASEPASWPAGTADQGATFTVSSTVDCGGTARRQSCLAEFVGVGADGA